MDLSGAGRMKVIGYRDDAASNFSPPSLAGVVLKVKVCSVDIELSDSPPSFTHSLSRFR